METPSLTDWMTASGTIVTAVAAVGTACIAWKAAKTWKEALQNQRYDECVAAATELEAAVYRCITDVDKRRREDIWKSYTEAWDHQTRFRSAFQVALRYRPENLAADIPERIDHIIRDQLKPTLGQGQGHDQAALDKIAKDIKSEVAIIRQRLGPT
jgi:hypothetical protein